MNQFRDSVKRFFTKNTPEAALAAAVFTAAAGFFTGALDAREAVGAIVAAFIAFGFSEANKDGDEAIAKSVE